MATRPFHSSARFLLVCALIQSGIASAAPVSEAVLSQNPPPLAPESVPVGPMNPTPPSAIPQPKVTNVFRCERKFVYLGKVYDCDSNVERDAERLRPLVSDEPAALAALDSYQQNRETARKFAYVGSVGLVAAIGGELLSRTFTDSNGNTTATGTEVRNYGVFGGVGLALISFFASLATLSKGNNYIKDAVSVHNEAHPDTPIQLIHF